MSPSLHDKGWAPPSLAARARATAYAVLGLFAASSALGAQSLSDFHLRSWNGHFRLGGEFWDESRSSATTQIEERETVIREELFLKALGYYYHPKLWEYDLRGTLGLEQRSVDSSGRLATRSIDSKNLGWDFRSRFFKDNAYSAQVYSYRNETQTRQSFFATNEATISEFGGGLYARDWWVPSRLSARKYKYRGKGLDTYQEDRSAVTLEGNRLGDRLQLQYAAEVNDVSLGTSSQDYRDLSLNGSATALLGEKKRNRWFNSYRSRKQTGDVESANTGATSSFHWQLTDDLVSDSVAQFTSSETNGSSKTDTLNLTTGIGHQLYESLASNFALNIGRSTVDSGAIDTEGFTGRLDYRKRTPLGRLGLDYSVDFYVQDQDDLQGNLPILDEAQTYSPGTPIFLSNPAVLTPSIVITDAAGVVTYLLGTDYLVVVLGSRTRIDIPIGSRINPGDTILVDYSFAPSPAIEFTSLTQAVGFSFRVPETADLQLNRTRVTQDLRSGIDTGILQDTTRTSASLSTYPFKRTTVGLDWEKYESDFSPFQRSALLVAYDRMLRTGTVWRTAFNAYRTTFAGQSEPERGLSATLSIVGAVGPQSTWDARLEWRSMELRTDQGTGLMAEGSYHRRLPYFDIDTRLRYTNEQFDVASDQEILALFLTLTRRF